MYVKCFAQINLVFRSLNRIFGLWPKIGCTTFELRSKVLTFLRPDGSKRRAEREKTQKTFGFLLTNSYLCTHETSSTQEEPRPAFPD